MLLHPEKIYVSQDIFDAFKFVAERMAHIKTGHLYMMSIFQIIFYTALSFLLDNIMDIEDNG